MPPEQSLNLSGSRSAGTASTRLPPSEAPGLTISARKEFGRLRVFEGLLWAEWYAHSRLLLGFLILWLVGVWVLPLLAHPGWILSLGFLYALLAGPAYGGGDVMEGCEEFTFALPVTRSARYLARLAVGGGALLLLTALDLLALGLNLSTALARLYLDTGLIKPLPVLKPGLLYGLVLAFPWAVFAFSYALSAVTHSRFLVVTAWFWGGLSALAALHFSLQYEEFMWNQMNGFFSCPVLLALGGAELWIGHQLYRRKETGHYAGRFNLPQGWWVWLLLLVGGLATALFLITALARQLPKFIGPG